MFEPHPAFILALALAAGTLAQSLARHLRVPGIVLLLFAGAALGPDGLGWVRPRDLGDGLLAIVELAVAVILFEGGLNLEISRLRREQAAIRRLVTWGALITLVGGAAAFHWTFDAPLLTSLLFGSLVVVTGPTVVGPIVRELRLRPRLATVLEAEGVLIDPVGAIVAVLMLELALEGGIGTALYTGEARYLLLRIGFGTGAGIAAGFAIAGILRVRRLLPEGHENIFVLAFVLLLFQGCDEIVSESGILAVTIAGVVVGNLRTPVDRDLREFKDQLTVLLIGLLFVLLAADVRLADVRALGWPGVIVVASLVLVVRPLSVALCTSGTELTWRERVFVAWIAPRGIVAAAVASVTATALAEAGQPGGEGLRALVFLTIASTVVLAGTTGPLVARLLDVRLPGRDRIAILGAHGLGMKLAEALHAAGRSVVVLDSNPQNCRRAEEAGFAVIFGDALQERTLQRARFESVGLVLGVTPNQMLNSVFASRARERFGVPEGYIAVVRPEQGLAQELVDGGEVRILFDGPHDVERWDVRVRRREVEVESWRFEGPPEDAEEPPAVGEAMVLLTVERGARVFPMHAGRTLEADDIVSVAIHVPDRDAAHEALEAMGFRLNPPAEQSPEATPTALEK